MKHTRLEGITYTILSEGEIRAYVIKICEKEWDAADFPKYGADLYNSSWHLEEIDVNKITINKEMLRSESFQKDLQPRINVVQKLLLDHEAIPPLILRGTDYLLFDGYARYHVFKEQGVTKCFAYVGD